MRLASILLALATVASPVHSAQFVAAQGSDEVRLFTDSCQTGSVLRFIREDQRGRFSKAQATINGQKWFACWVRVDESVILVYEDGDQGVLPYTMFAEQGT